MWFSETVTKGLKVAGVTINFMPSWWYEHYGIGYGRKMIFDADYRIEAHRSMREAFYQRFGRQIRAGTADPKPMPIPPDWQNAWFQAMHGFEIRYPEDQYPMSHGAISPEQFAARSIPEDLFEVFPFSELKRQVMYLNDKLQTAEPLLFPMRGILNEAIQVCSTDFYGDLLDETCTEQTETVLAYIQQIMRQQLLWNDEKARGTPFVALNCTAAVAGARTYQTRVLPYDVSLYQFCRARFIPYGIHHCGKIDDFIDIYQAMPETYFIEIGHESAIRLALTRHEWANVQYIMDTTLMNQGTPREIQAKIEEILEQTAGHWSRFSIAVPDIEHSMPDENLLSLIEALEK